MPKSKTIKSFRNKRKNRTFVKRNQKGGGGWFGNKPNVGTSVGTSVGNNSEINQIKSDISLIK